MEGIYLNAIVNLGVEGTIYEHYPEFPNRVNEALRELFGEKVDRINIGVSRIFRGNAHFDLEPELTIFHRQLQITRDGNGIGAALAAMLAHTKQA